MTARLVSLIIGYFCGLVQTGYLYGKAKGIDIRQHGSGNAGTTNTLRTLGPKAGLIVLLGDMLKTLVAIFISWLLFHKSNPDIMPLLKVYATAGAVLGHDFPFYLKFKGGKGIAVTAGLIVGLFNPLILIIEAIIFFGIFFTTHYVSLGSLMLYLGLVVQVIVFGQLGIGDIGAMAPGPRMEMYLILFTLMVLAYWQHRANIGRLLSNSERKTYIKQPEAK